MYITDLQNENVHQIIHKKHSHTLKKVLNQMSLNPKSLYKSIKLCITLLKTSQS